MDIKNNYYLYYRVTVPSTVTRASHPARKIGRIAVIPQQLQQRMQRICDRRGRKETALLSSAVVVLICPKGRQIPFFYCVVHLQNITFKLENLAVFSLSGGNR